MNNLPLDADKLYLQTQQDMVGVALTPQQEKLVLLIFRGVSVKAAASHVGMDTATATEMIESEVAQYFIEEMRKREAKNIEITRDRLTLMLLEAHANSATAMEEIAAIRELGKMHDMYEDNKKATTQINVKVTNVKQIEKASDEELMKIVGETIDLDPSHYEIEQNDKD